MAILKCKQCGGDLNLIEGASTAECEYCGSVQTVPKVDDEKKLTLFARANRLRAACEFDKAAGVYEAIVADFPEEAEAYWGLVLCKYGIEYVDDPGSDKKIPTCHRSSFDSVMEDSDFEQTLENADPIARKIYRDEAKQIEEIRKSIIAVSSNEQPYDIFICYKETDEKGDRTLDSVLAQDIYDTLVTKDYRVFFARITLEDRLGVEFEPYIFAALNSAKIMLAVGTDYEYYNAVWVKNEWSRYLKLMAKDKYKHLIPCYKGIDAYDMPKEFSKLQAQDLGKVGAMQDLLRGIEKILPKQKSTTVIQERVVVGNGGDNKIASLLDRGNMALEDGDWDKADSFFEDVLNNDSKNAQAYLGKTLAEEKCRTLEALIRKLKDACQQEESKQLYLQEDDDHIDASVQKHAIEGYVDKDKIRKLYEFDLSYSSTVESRKQQCKDVENWWKNHKWLSRAEKFAAGESAQILQQARNDLFSALNARIAKAEQAELEAYNRKLEQYQAHLKQADEDAQELFTSGSYARQMDYEIACGEVEKSMDLKVLNRATDTLRRLSGYENSVAKHEEGLEKIREITARQQEAEAAEKERQQKEAEIARKKKEKEDSICAIVLLLLILAAVAGIAYAIYHFAWAKPKQKYDVAIAHFEAGEYQEAIILFGELKYFKDSEDKLPEAKYAYADRMLQDGDVDGAYILFSELAGYDESKNQYVSSGYLDARERRIKIIRENPRFAQVGDIVCYGEYEQDNNLDNGKEPIEWFVYSYNGNEILLVSKNALDCRRYHTEDRTTADWENSDIRKWLNSDFYNNAFSESQKAQISTSTLKTPGQEEENVTQDAVFLLSKEDCSDEKASNFIFEGYQITDYAKSRVPYGSPAATGMPYETQYTYHGFWLREPIDPTRVYVRYDALSNSFDSGIGARSNYDYAFVRPCICLNVEGA